jgi:hypothetical protein
MTLPPAIADWFAQRGWRVRQHQWDMLEAARAGEHALLVADTGAGKTLAGFLPTLADFAGDDPPRDGLHTLYVSPLKALAHDVQRNLLTPVDDIGLPLRIETRSGDTPSDRKARQRVKPPHVLLTTPESLSLLLSYPEAATMFAGLKRVIVDEIHAFATGKRCRWPGCKPLPRTCAARRFLPLWPILTTSAAGLRLMGKQLRCVSWMEKRAPRLKSRSSIPRISACRGEATPLHGRCRSFMTPSARTRSR